MSIIKAENLGKKYIIGHNRGESGMFRYKSLRDSMAHWGRSALETLKHPLRPNREMTELEEFWALKDINFEIEQGERVGIIGRNGAGKSTLLKLLSRVTEPTTGKIILNGRVASLLEVGTGFHPELTGRENIYLNGSVLGMTRAEIKRKFDEIVAFAEVEKFLDTPVKRYSSGMYVRLAFAVAAHLEPDILLVDEVLAVGDAAFQKKCLGKMEDVSKEGRTVFFVSHNMAAVENLCDKVFVLGNGILLYEASSNEAIEYYSRTVQMRPVDDGTHKNPYGGNLIIKNVFLKEENGNTASSLAMGADFSVEILAEGLVENDANIGVLIRNADGVLLTSVNDIIKRPKVIGVRGRMEKIVFKFKGLNLSPGTWLIDVSVTDRQPQRIDYYAEAKVFEVIASDYYGTGFGYNRSYGYVFPDVEVAIYGHDSF